MARSVELRCAMSAVCSASRSVVNAQPDSRQPLRGCAWSRSSRPKGTCRALASGHLTGVEAHGFAVRGSSRTSFRRALRGPCQTNFSGRVRLCKLGA